MFKLNEEFEKNSFGSKSTMKFILLLLMMTKLCAGDVSDDLQKAFTEHGVIPDVLSVAPKNRLQVSYSSGVFADLGNVLQPTEVKDAPQIKWEAEKGAYYTLIMVDPDAPSRFNPELREIRHWTVMNIPENQVENGETIFEYIGAGPPKGTDFHRYIFLVFKQPNGIIDHKLSRITNRSLENRPKTFVLQFAKTFNLGDPEFGNFFQSEYDEYSDVLLKQLNFQR